MIKQKIEYKAYCDHCDQEIKGPGGVLQIGDDLVIESEFGGYSLVKASNIHLCERCADMVRRWAVHKAETHIVDNVELDFGKANHHIEFSGDFWENYEEK